MSIYTAIISIFWAVFVLWWIVSSFSVKRGTRSVPRWLGIRISIVLVLILVFRSSFFQRLDAMAAPGPAVSIVGILLAGTGIMFAIRARRYLGKNWGMPMTVKEHPELVTSGPYALVRHPIYSGVLLAMLGSALVAGPTWFAVFIVFSFYFIFSAVNEEKLKLKEFPDQYPAYKKGTKMLIPYIF